MPRPSDPTIKTLVEISPGDWLRLTGHAPAPTRVIDADVATIRGAADKVIRVDDRTPLSFAPRFSGRARFIQTAAAIALV